MANKKNNDPCAAERELIKTLLKQANQPNITGNQKAALMKRITRLTETVRQIDMQQALKRAQEQRAKILQERREDAKKLAEEKKREDAEKRAKEEAHILEVTEMELASDWTNIFAGDSRAQGVHADSISDALILSLSNLARVDIEYMASITGEDLKTIICALKGSIYQNPETWEEVFYKGWETAEQYLSGNLLKKLKVATEANKKFKGYFNDNIAAIKKVLPQTVSAKEIYITLGSPWVPTDIIDDFINHILNIKSSKSKYSGTLHDELTGTWDIPKKGQFYWISPIACYSTYGTRRMYALEILEHTLNMKTVSVTDEIECSTTKSNKKRVINHPETVLALEKQQLLIKEFQKWVWKDPLRKERLEDIFDSKFGCVRRRIFNGAFLEFPTLSRNIELFPYQKNAIARILFSDNTLLAHDVGSGKTYIMIAAGMELRRMGLSKKNLYVVPNNLVGQWNDIFLEMYPSANILCVEHKNFTPAKKNTTLKTIRDCDFDAIIMAYSCFDRIPLSLEYYIDELEETRIQIARLEKEAKKTTSGLKRKRESVEKEIHELNEKTQEMKHAICFDELGINRLFVDEAHNYKNVAVETKTERVLGISPTGSKKCRDMMDKVHHIQKTNNGGGVIMATGTPITNSVTDAFVMQKYLQSGELALLDLQSFDSWIGMFAERVTEFEIDVDTSSYRLATRFAKFHNLPELTTLLSSVADFHQVDPSAGIPDFAGYEDALIPKTPTFAKYLDEISARAEIVRHGKISRKDDNMLKITTDGRKAALDIRLVVPDAFPTYNSKVMRCAEKVTEIYRATAPQKSVQLIFCDSSTPKPEFNIYSELKRLLISNGIPEREIAFIHDASTESQREKLFEQTRNGDIRILLGSTFKLGLGVNVQDKLIALHHLDIPWRPADMTQREGRILRQGNQNKQVYIYRYITEGSFDSYSWQLLETKQRFISGLLSGSITERSGTDIDDTVLSYAEVKALAVGNPLVKERVETANELSRYLSLQKKAIENHIRLEKEKMEMPNRIAQQERVIEKCVKDIELYKQSMKEYNADERRYIREAIFDAVKKNVLMTEETTLMSYQGFDIVLPINMTDDKPFLWLKGSGRYHIDLGKDSAVGVIIRIDNFLNKLDEHLTKLNDVLAKYNERLNAISEELTRKNDYTDKIEKYTRKLSKIDKELGVNQK